MAIRHILFVVLLLFTGIQSQTSEAIDNLKFPDGFLFGVATASYQIEGAWNVSGKGENIWDRFTHQRPDKIRDRSTGDIACDSYHKYKTDVALMKDLGVHFYRFSISWARILPTGRRPVNSDGIKYYNDLITELEKNNIIPMVTMYHWDLPQVLEDQGGWQNDDIVNAFADYARVLYENYASRVNLWLTFNEPKQTCLHGYSTGILAPGKNISGGEYRCAHNLIKSHAKAYHIYNREFKNKYNGRVGIAIDLSWLTPFSDAPEDVAAAKRGVNFGYDWYAQPILGKTGNYPETMIKFIGERSAMEELKESRLPSFTKEEINYIQGSYDYLGMNHYTTNLAKDVPWAPVGVHSFYRDIKLNSTVDSSWPQGASSWFYVVPFGFRESLKYIKRTYGDVSIYITENGYSDFEGVNDNERVKYYELYLKQVLDAINEDKVNIVGYTAWSLLDNFEWMDGYINRFGLHHVNFSHPDRPRTPKLSAKWYKKLISLQKKVESAAEIPSISFAAISLCVLIIRLLF